MIRSMQKLMTVSTVFPIAADAIPRIRATAALTTAAKIPINMLIERPFSVLASISLPSQSVPKIYSRQGAIFFLEKSVALASSVLKLPHMQITARKTTEKPSPIRILCLRFHIFILPYPLSGSWDQ